MKKPIDIDKLKLDDKQKEKRVKEKHARLAHKLRTPIEYDDAEKLYEVKADDPARSTPGSRLFGYPPPVFINPDFEELLNDVETVCGNG